MNIFSLMLTVLSVFYIVLGISVFRLDKRSRMNILFLTLNILLFIWSFATALYISAQSELASAIWYRISSVGSYLFIGSALHFFLFFTKQQKFLNRWWKYLILYFPSIFFAFIELAFDFYSEGYVPGQYGWVVIARTNSIWFVTSLVYIIGYIVACVMLSARFGKTAESIREKNQARVLHYTAAISLVIGLIILVVSTVLVSDLPDITPFSGAIWSIGIYYAIAKYKLLLLTPSYIAENLYKTIADSVILANPYGEIININPEAQRLLGYSESELVGASLEKIFCAESRSENNISELLNQCPVRGAETYMVTKTNEKTPVILSISECSDQYQTRLGFVLASKDVTEYKKAEEKIQYLATHDSLTGLPNRSMFTQLLEHAILSAKRNNKMLAVLFVDLDRFKTINDTKGHDAGDQLLITIARRYQSALRASDVVCRQGGDEFVILIEDVLKPNELKRVAGHIISTTYEPVILMGDECRVTASVGISVYPADGEDAQTLMKHADIAMYCAKEEGKNDYKFYSKDLQSVSMNRLAIERNLRLALERHEFSLHYQAKVNFKTGAITGVEALLRWQSPELGNITPTQFIPIAEETGIIVPIGKWVLRTACAQNVAWQKQGLPAVRMAVNLSLRQLLDSNLPRDIEQTLHDSGMDAEYLELEVTESMIMNDPRKMITILQRIKSMGVRLAIDDFGTGYSSLAQLKQFPVDTLKIDRSFIRNITEDSDDKAIAHAIISMGESLGLTVVAEGVETIEQLNYLKGQACDEMQGFYFSKPVVADQFAELLKTKSDGGAGLQ
jgi:diguanylate cyclase (GGDEF)-like protein/PAS domain S-box-containing protein